MDSLAAPLAPGMRARAASITAFTCSWVVVYAGALLHPDRRLPLLALVFALVSAAIHLSIEARLPRSERPAWVVVVLTVAWLGWLMPMMSLRVLWPLGIASLAGTVGLGLASRGTSPEAASPQVARVVSHGGWLRSGVAVIWLAALAMAAMRGDSGAVTSSLALPLLLASGLSRSGEGGWRRVALVCATVTTCAAVAALGLGLGAARGTALASAAVLGVGALLLAVSVRVVDGDVRVRAAWWVSCTAGLATFAAFAASAASPLSLLDAEARRALVPPPQAWTPLVSALDLAAVGVLAGGRALRDAPLVLTRLGLRWPGLLPIAVCTAGGLGMAVLMQPLADVAEALGASSIDTDLLRRLFGGDRSTIIASSMIAGVGEEVLFRGLLQPRIGLVATTALFAAMHALQYDALGIVVVAALGLVFGAIARRWGTGASIAAHVAYNGALSFGFA